jgi:transposase
VITGSARACFAIMADQPLWDQFAALLPERTEFELTHPLGCHRRRISDRIVFDELLQMLRFGCSYQGIADISCSASTIRNRRDEWIKLGIFAQLKTIALDAYDRIVGLLLENIAVDGCITQGTNAWHNAFNRLQCCYERREVVIDAFFDLADTIITVRNLIRKAWTIYRWDTRPTRRP